MKQEAPSVLIPLAEGFEELEAVTLITLLRRAGARVLTAGLKPGAVTGARGCSFNPDTELDAVLEQSFDLIALPGGLPGANHLRDDARVQALLRRQADAGRLLGAICAAPKALASAGLLTGRRVTHYPGAVENAGFTATGAAVEADGAILTSRGPGTAMDFGLALIERLFDRARREQVEQTLVRD
ncbi:MAG: DJ-1/PfpI family protein [Halothiobacillaceae bacterium]|nr:DJ-1/PfpI family protein [Halothiobacillaceae bacterium]